MIAYEVKFYKLKGITRQELRNVEIRQGWDDDAHPGEVLSYLSGHDMLDLVDTIRIEARSFNNAMKMAAKLMKPRKWDEAVIGEIES